MNIIFDLDGTLIDASERLYRLFQYLIPQSTMSKEEYWNKKRNKIGHRQMLKEGFPIVDFEKFNKRWLSLIETQEYLTMDQCYPDTIRILKQLSLSSPLYLLTARQSKENLLEELRRLNIADYFNRIFVTANRYSKEELLERVMEEETELFSSENVFVSDMGKDIKLGKKENFITVAITHGFMSREKLLEYLPDHCIDKLEEIINLLYL